VNVLDEDTEDGRTIALQSLSNAQLIQILQHHDGDDDLTQMVEDELARRKAEGTPQSPLKAAEGHWAIPGWFARISRCGNGVSVQ
jgi:hypothetical protein